eukprot:1871560-Prymnesium_polylepis.1
MTPTHAPSRHRHGQKGLNLHASPITRRRARRAATSEARPAHAGARGRSAAVFFQAARTFETHVLQPSATDERVIR